MLTTIKRSCCATKVNITERTQAFPMLLKNVYMPKKCMTESFLLKL